MAKTTTLEQVIQRAERTLELWHRVCAETEEKDWSEIDNGLDRTITVEFWEAYMRQRMFHHLEEVVVVYRNGNC